MDQELLNVALPLEWPTGDRTASASTPLAPPELTEATTLRLFPLEGQPCVPSVTSLLDPGSGLEVIMFLFSFSPTFDMGSCRNSWKTASSMGEMFLNSGAPDLLRPINHSINHLPFVRYSDRHCGRYNSETRQDSEPQQVNMFAKGLMIQAAQTQRLSTG